jgi:hypothetical protein
VIGMDHGTGPGVVVADVHIQRAGDQGGSLVMPMDRSITRCGQATDASPFCAYLG